MSCLVHNATSRLQRLALLAFACLACGCSTTLLRGPQLADERTPQFLLNGPGPVVGKTASRPALFASPQAVDPLVESGPSETGRKMTYSARFRIGTVDVEGTIDHFVKHIKLMGGYLESQDDSIVVVRIPATRFDEVVDGMKSLGKVLSRSIQAADVTTQHRDLNLRLETLAVARERLMALLAKAQNLDDVLKLEKQLREITIEVETAQAVLKGLNEKIVYSRIEVTFQAHNINGSQGPNKTSVIPWINRVGAEQLLNGFRGLETEAASDRRSLATLWPGFVEMKMPEGFLVVDRRRHDVKAVTSDSALLRLRQLDAPKSGAIDFWAESLRNHLAAKGSYDLVEQHVVRDRRGRKGREMTFDVMTAGVLKRYMVTLFLHESPFWFQRNTLKITEFLSPTNVFDDYIARLHLSESWQVETKTASEFVNVGKTTPATRGQSE